MKRFTIKLYQISMNKLLLIFIFCKITIPSFGQRQNLIINPGFELFDSTEIVNKFEYASRTGWEKISGFAWPGDYLWKTNFAEIRSPKQRYFEEQLLRLKKNTKADIGRYEMCLCFEGYINDSKKSYRGYIQSKLNSKMIKGKKYRAGFLCSFMPDWTQASVNSMGLLFVKNPISNTDLDKGYYIANAQVRSEEIISNMDNFDLVQDSFVAQDDYEYVIIGNFTPVKDMVTKPFPQIYGKDKQMLAFLSQNTETRYKIDNVFLYELADSVFIKPKLTYNTSQKVFFENNAFTLNANSTGELQAFIKTIDIQKVDSINVLGYSSQEGNIKANIALSTRRANIIKSYFLKKMPMSIPIRSKGMGISDVSSTEMAANRYVLIEVVYKK